MLTAIVDKKRVWAKESHDKNHDYICPYCRKKMILVKPSKKIIDHFRHYSKGNCGTEPETKEHLMGKMFLYDFFKNKYINIEMEYVFKEFQPDIFIVDDKNRKIAIEFQCSPISMDDFIYRTKRYTDYDIYVIWIFGTKKFLQEDTDNIYRLRNIEKKAHEIYFGNVYYLDGIDFKKIKFSVYTEIKSSEWGGFHYWTKYYKKLREIDNEESVVNPCISFKMNTWKDNNFLVGVL